MSVEATPRASSFPSRLPEILVCNDDTKNAITRQASDYSVSNLATGELEVVKGGYTTRTSPTLYIGKKSETIASLDASLYLSGTNDSGTVDSASIVYQAHEDTLTLTAGTVAVSGAVSFALGTSNFTVATSGYTAFDPGVGGDLRLTPYYVASTSLSTSGAATTITLSIPTGSLLLSVATNIITAVTGVSASGVTATLAFSGGSSYSIGTLVSSGDGNLAANTKFTKALNANAGSLVTTDTTNMTLTFSGGADNIASAGAIRVLVWALVPVALDSV